VGCRADQVVNMRERGVHGQVAPASNVSRPQMARSSVEFPDPEPFPRHGDSHPVRIQPWL